MNTALLARAEAAEAEAGPLQGELVDARAELAAEKATATAVTSTHREASTATARATQAEVSLAELRAAGGAPPRLDCPALPAELWAAVLGAVGTSR